MSATAQQSPIQQYANSLNSRPLPTQSPCPSCHDPNQLGNAALLEMMGGFEGDARLAGDEDFSILGFDGGFGVHEGPAGGTRIGTQAGGHLLDADLPIEGFTPLEGCNLETSLLNAGTEGSVGTDGFSVGLNADVAAGALACDTPKPEVVDRDLLRVGLSEGLGFGARGHWSDEDGDCRTEVGMGVDLGPFSVDRKTEAPMEWLLGTPEGCVN